MPERANIFWAEDSLDYIEMARDALEWDGHKLVLLAFHRRQALDLILQFRERHISAAVVGGNLNPGNDSGIDGRIIAETIRLLYPEVGIIGHSPNAVVGADIQIPKRETIRGLARAIAILPYPYRI